MKVHYRLKDQLLLPEHRRPQEHLGLSRDLEIQVHDLLSRRSVGVHPWVDSSGDGPSSPCRLPAHRNLRAVMHKPHQRKPGRASFRGRARCLRSGSDVATDRRNHIRKESAR